MTTYSKLLLFAATLSAAALLASTTSSCTKSDETEATGSRKAAPGAVRTETVSIAIEDDEATKTTFDPSTGAFSWQNGDKIGVQVYNTSTKAITYKECTINTTEASARFTVTLAENEIRGGWCYYPSNIAASPTSLASTSITLPSSYDSYVSGYAPTPMYAINDPSSTKLYFRHLGGVLRLNVTAPSDMPASADKIVVTLTGGNIAGNYTASYAGFYQIPSGGSSTSVTYNLASSLAANGSQVVFVPVPTGVTFSAITVYAYSGSSRVGYAAPTISAFTSSRAHGKQFTAALAVPTATPVIDQSACNVTSGGKIVFTASDSYGDAMTSGITWSSSNTMVAKVDESTGIITGGYIPGTAQITATYNTLFPSDPVTVTVITVPTNCIKGMFSVGADSRICFSNGNLRATSSSAFTFATNQYSYGQGVYGMSSGSYYFNYENIFTSSSSNNNETNTSYVSGITDLGSQWRLMTKDEQVYLLHTRSTTIAPFGRYSVIRYRGTSIFGLLIYPDGFTESDWVTSTMGTMPTNRNSASVNSATYTESNITAMGNAGIVFLPAAGSYYSSEYHYYNLAGIYWSASSNDSNSAYELAFDSSKVYQTEYGYKSNDYLSVRLVQNQ